MAAIETNAILKTKLSHSGKLHELTDEEVKTVQGDLLEIFRDMKTVLDKEGIPYTFGGGSVLGAVRHEGFIPWDDDIDINIERRYLLPFKEAMEKNFGDKYYVQAPVLSLEHYSVFWDVQKRGTVYRESLAQAEGKCGLKVDIFPIENTYKNPILRGIHRVLSDGCLLILSCIRFHDRKAEYMDLAGDDETTKSLIQKKALLGTPFAPFRKGWFKFANAVFAMCKKDDSEYVVVPSGRGHFIGEVYKRADFAVPTDATFEGLTVSVPRETTAYLTRLFGPDYMTLPPENKREHHMIYEMEL